MLDPTALSSAIFSQCLFGGSTCILLQLRFRTCALVHLKCSNRFTKKTAGKNIADDEVVRSNIKLLTNIPIVDNDRDCERPTVCR